MEEDQSGKKNETLQALLAPENPSGANDGKAEPDATPVLPSNSAIKTRSSDKKILSKKLSPTRSSTQSPDPNCSICLGKLENKSFTDSCFHMFCFACLLEWSKVKAECPLCKQPFKSIIHNVRSYEDYDQYHVQEAQERQTSFTWESPEGYRFRYRTTMNFERLMDVHYREQQRQLRLLQRPTVTTRHQWRSRRQGATSEFRRRIYLNGMRVKAANPAVRQTRQRKTGPEFYLRNPACMHRLVPWLNRELNALLHSQQDHVHFIMELIMDLIKRVEIDSEDFFEHLNAYIGRHTRHFIHEFLHFARSPYDMIAYDQHAEYEQHAQTIESDHEISSASSSPGSDIIIVDEIVGGSSNLDSSNLNRQSLPSDTHNPEPPSVDRLLTVDFSPILSRVKSFVNSTKDVLANSGWDSPTPGPSGMFSSPPEEIRITVSPPVSDTVSSSTTTISRSTVNLSPTTVTSPNVKSEEKVKMFTGVLSEDTAPINATSDSDEDSDGSVIFVKVDKPWERTPILLSSDSEEEKMVEVGSKAKKSKEKKKYEDRQRSNSGMSADWSSDSTIDVVSLNDKKSRKSKEHRHGESHKSHKRKKSKKNRDRSASSKNSSSNGSHSKDTSSKPSKRSKRSSNGEPHHADGEREPSTLDVSEPDRPDRERQSASRESCREHREGERGRRREREQDIWCTSYSQGCERGLSPLSCLYGYQSSYGSKYGQFFQWLHFNEDRVALDYGDHGYYTSITRPMATSYDGKHGRYTSRSHERERQTHRSRSRTPSPRKRSAEKDKQKRGKRSRSSSVEFIAYKSSKYSQDDTGNKKHHSKKHKHKKHKHKKSKGVVEIDLEPEIGTSKPSQQSTPESVNQEAVYVELRTQDTPNETDSPKAADASNTAGLSDEMFADSVTTSTSSQQSSGDQDSGKKYKKHPTGHKASGKNGNGRTVKINRSIIMPLLKENVSHSEQAKIDDSAENVESSNPRDGSVDVDETNQTSTHVTRASSASNTIHHRSSTDESSNLQSLAACLQSLESDESNRNDKKNENLTKSTTYADSSSGSSTVSYCHVEDIEEIDVVTCDVSVLGSSDDVIGCDISPVTTPASLVESVVPPTERDISWSKRGISPVTCDTSSTIDVTCDVSPEGHVSPVTSDVSVLDVVTCDKSPAKCDVSSTFDVVTCHKSPIKCGSSLVIVDESPIKCDSSQVSPDESVVITDPVVADVVTRGESPLSGPSARSARRSTPDFVTWDQLSIKMVTAAVLSPSRDTSTPALDVVTCDTSTINEATHNTSPINPRAVKTKSDSNLIVPPGTPGDHVSNSVDVRPRLNQSREHNSEEDTVNLLSEAPTSTDWINGPITSDEEEIDVDG